MATKKPDEVQANVGTAQTTQSGNSGSGSYSSSYTVTTAPEVPEPPPSQLPSQLPVETQHEDIPDAPDLRPELDQWLAAAQEQANNQIDYATQQGITELQRAQEDAQPQFQQMRNQVDADEARALDNQVLYAEARGDRGGIGQAQYGSIQNTAAQNRLQVQQQQTKLATDTSRAIADLRAKGEFEKADKMLQLTQTYLSQLMQLEQWAAEYNMNAAQFRESINQWEAEYRTKVAQILEDQRQWDASYALQRANFLQSQYEYNEQFQWQKDQAERGTLADAGQALLSAGIMPSESQLAAMGMTSEQAKNYIAALQLSIAAGGGGGNPGKNPGESPAGNPYDPTNPDSPYYNPGSPGGLGSPADNAPLAGNGSGVPVTFGGTKYDDEVALMDAMIKKYGNGKGNIHIPADVLSDLSRVTQHFWGLPAKDFFKQLGYSVSSGVLNKAYNEAKNGPVTVKGKQYNSPAELAAALPSLNLTDKELANVNAWAAWVWGKQFKSTGGQHGGHGSHGNNKTNMVN